MNADILVVVPTRGERMPWLRQSLASIVSQDVPVRCVVVSPAEAREVRELADHMSVEWQREVGQGMAGAINQVWANANEPFVTWLGDDDLLAEGSLRRTRAALLGRGDASMAYGACRIIDSTGARLWTIRPGRVSAALMRVGSQLVPQPGCLIRAEALSSTGMLDPSLRNTMDLDLFLRLRQWGPLVYVPAVVAAFRRHEHSLTLTNPEPGLEAARVRQRYLSPRVARWAMRLESQTQFASKVLARVQIADPRTDRQTF